MAQNERTNVNKFREQRLRSSVESVMGFLEVCINQVLYCRFGHYIIYNFIRFALHGKGKEQYPIPDWKGLLSFVLRQEWPPRGDR